MNGIGFKELFGFDYAGVGNIESDIVVAKLREFAAPYHEALVQQRELSMKYNKAEHGLDAATMLADHAKLIELRKKTEETSAAFRKAVEIAKSAGISVDGDIGKYQPKTTPAK